MKQWATRAIHPRAEWIWLAGSGAVLVLAATMSATVEVVTVLDWEIPSLCLWQRTTGWDCLGCGLTRSMVFMGHGQLSSAFQAHTMGPVLFSFLAAQVPFRVARLLWHRKQAVHSN